MISKLEKAIEFNAYLRGVGMGGTVMWFISSIDAVKMSVAHRTLGETLTKIASEKTCNGNIT